MKKFVLSLVTILTCGSLAQAQNDCMALFPTDYGTVLVNQTYDGSNNLLYTTTYKVSDVRDYPSGTETELVYMVKGPNENIQESGSYYARCSNGYFSLNLVNRGMVNNFTQELSSTTELVADYLDYPNTFGSDDYLGYNSTFEMDPGTIIIQSKTDKAEQARVSISNRRLDKSEKIQTPAGEFHASRINFDVEVYDKGADTRTKYKGVEWYALGSGIVRTEIYDNNNNLLNYTVLTDVEDPRDK